MDDSIEIECDRKPCSRKATRIIAFHFIDHCADGIKVYLMCGPCANDLARRLDDIVTRMKNAVLQCNSNAWLICESCGMRIESVDDVRDVRSIGTTRLIRA